MDPNHLSHGNLNAKGQCYYQLIFVGAICLQMLVLYLFIGLFAEDQMAFMLAFFILYAMGAATDRVKELDMVLDIKRYYNQVANLASGVDEACAKIQKSIDGSVNVSETIQDQGQGAVEKGGSDALPGLRTTAISRLPN